MIFFFYKIIALGRKQDILQSVSTGQAREKKIRNIWRSAHNVPNFELGQVEKLKAVSYLVPNLTIILCPELEA